MAEAETKSDKEAAPPVSTKREGVPFEIPVLPLTNTTIGYALKLADHVARTVDHLD